MKCLQLLALIARRIVSRLAPALIKNQQKVKSLKVKARQMVLTLATLPNREGGDQLMTYQQK